MNGGGNALFFLDKYLYKVDIVWCDVIIGTCVYIVCVYIHTHICDIYVICVCICTHSFVYYLK